LLAANQRASRTNPCPACGGTDKCLTYLSDLPNACFCCNPPEHLKTSHNERFSQQFGRAFWIISYNQVGGEPIPADTPNTTPPNSCWDGYQKAYRDLHARLHLSPFWKEHLLKRGFTAEEIEKRGYRSIPYSPTDIVEPLYLLYKQEWQRIPGFVFSSSSPTILGEGCLLIPIRDINGEIRAFQLRNRDGKNPKYRWFSHDSLLSTPIHHNPSSSTDLFLTEGPLKADYLSYKIGARILSYQGVNSLACLPLELEKIKGVTRAFIANDADGWYDTARRLATAKAHMTASSVSAGTWRTLQILQRTDWLVRVLKWEVSITDGIVRPKGIDDWLRGKTTLLSLSPIEYQNLIKQEDPALAYTLGFG